MILLRFRFGLVITLISFLICMQKGLAQFTEAEIGVNGLTCSQCSRSVEIGILKLDFIKDVKMDLENTNGKIIFKEGAEINFNKIAKAVTDAGFSIRFLKATYSFNNAENLNNVILLNVKDPFYIINNVSTKLSGAIQLLFIGREFLSKKEFNKWKKVLKRNFGEIKKDHYYIVVQG